MKYTKRQKNTLLISSVEIIGSILSIILGVIKTHYFIKYLGSEGNGMYQLALQLLSFTALVNTGMGGVFLVKYYKAFENDENADISSIYNASKVFYTVTAGLMLVMSFVLGFVFYFTVNDASYSFGYLFLIMVLFCVPGIVNTFGSPKFILTMGRQKRLILSLMYVVNSAIRPFVAVLVVQRFSFLTYVIIDTLLYIAILAIQYLICVHINRDIVIDNTVKFDRRMLNYSKYTLFVNYANLIYQSSDNVVISIFLGLADVSIYNAYYFVVVGVNSLITALTNGFIDSLGSLYAAKEKYFDHVFNQIGNILFYVAISISIPIMLGIRPFVSLFISGSAQYTIDNMTLIMLVLIMYVCTMVKQWDILIYGTGKYEKIWKVSALEAIMNIVLSIVLVQKLGLLGVLVGTVTSRMIRLLYNNIILSKEYGLDSSKLINNFLIKTFIATTIIICMSLITIPMKSIFAWIISETIITLLSFGIIGVIFMLINKEFASQIKTIFNRNK